MTGWKYPTIHCRSHLCKIGLHKLNWSYQSNNWSCKSLPALKRHNSMSPMPPMKVMFISKADAKAVLPSESSLLGVRRLNLLNLLSSNQSSHTDVFEVAVFGENRLQGFSGDIFLLCIKVLKNVCGAHRQTRIKTSTSGMRPWWHKISTASSPKASFLRKTSAIKARLHLLLDTRNYFWPHPPLRYVRNIQKNKYSLVLTFGLK